MSFHLYDIQRKTPDFVRQFGSAQNIDSGDVPIDIWSLADIYPQYTFPSNLGETMYICSSSALDTTTVSIQGLDENFESKQQNITLQGNTVLTLNGKWTRINQIFNYDSSDIAGNVYVFTNTTVIDGVPQSGTAIKSVIENGFNQSLVGIYTVPRKRVFHATSYQISCDAKNANTLVNATVEFAVRMNVNGIFRTQEIIAISNYCPANVNLQMPFPIVGPADIKPTIRSLTTNSVEIHCTFDGMLL